MILTRLALFLFGPPLTHTRIRRKRWTVGAIGLALFLFAPPMPLGWLGVFIMLGAFAHFCADH